MLHEQAVPTNALAAFETIIERRIAERTWGRIRDLRVEVAAERIVVRGWTSTYYVKQLAIQALLEETRSTMRFPVIDMEIVVDGVPAGERDVGCTGAAAAVPPFLKVSSRLAHQLLSV